MASITAAQSGNWSATSTWTGGVVPGDGDTATITTQTVTMDQNVTIGTSGVTGTAAITISSTGKLAINNGVTLNLKGDLVNTHSGTNFGNTTDYLTVGSGVTINVIAPNGSTYYNIGTGSSGNTSRVMRFNGTSASPVTTPGTCVVGANATGINAGCMYARWVNFIDIGSSSLKAVIFRNFGENMLWDVQYCRFTRCGLVTNGGGGASLNGGAEVYRLKYCVFENSLGDGQYCFTVNGANNPVTTGALEVCWNYFDLPVLSANSINYLTIDDNWFNANTNGSNSPLQTAAVGVNQTANRNVFRKQHGSNLILSGLNLDKCYAIIDYESDNPHFIDSAVNPISWDVTVQRTAFEFTGNTVVVSSDAVGDLILFGDGRSADTGTPRTVNVKNCLSIPSGTKYPAGAFVTAFAAGSNNLKLTFDNNTSFIGSSGGSIGGTVSIHEGSAMRAVGTVNLSGGAVTGVTITQSGAYSAVTTAGQTVETPTVTITGNGTGATAHAVMNGSGNVSSVVIDTPGSGYTTASVTFSFPQYSSQLNTINSIRNNLFWDYSPNYPAVWQWSQDARPDQTKQMDVIPASTVGYNAMYNVAASHGGKTYINAGGGYAGNFTNAPGTAGGPGAGDITANPQFVDQYRSYFTFSSRYLGTSATRGAWSSAGVSYAVGDVVSFSDPTYYSGNVVNFRCLTAHTSNMTTTKPGLGTAQTWRTYWEPQTLTDVKNLYLSTRAAGGTTDATLGLTNASPAELLRTWVYKGFAPTNSALKAAGYGGVDMGAVAVNTAPVANAGLDQSVYDNALPITLTGSVLDDGVSTYQWTKVSGPGTVTFGSSTALTTTVNFSVVGTYVLRLTATDDAGQVGSDDVQVVVQPYVNTAPAVSASAGYPVMVTLTGSGTDDQTLTFAWTKVSGPGTVTFGTPSSASTTATFSATGSYVLRLSANDGFLTTDKDVTVVLSSATSGTNPVVATFGFGFTMGL